MKKFLTILLTAVCILLVGGCHTDDNAGGGAQFPPAADTEQGAGDHTDGSDSVEEEGVITISCGGNTLEIELAYTISARDLSDRLQGGDITISMHGYGGFEMVGALGFSLERQDVNMTTQTGDVVLYSGNQLVIFYDSNTWVYTKIGRINAANEQVLHEFFGTSGEVDVTLSLK